LNKQPASSAKTRAAKQSTPQRAPAAAAPQAISGLTVERAQSGFDGTDCGADQGGSLSTAPFQPAQRRSKRRRWRAGDSLVRIA